MTKVRFEKLKSYLNNPAANVRKNKEWIHKPYRTTQEFYEKWIDFDEDGNQSKFVYSPEEEEIRKEIANLYKQIDAGETVGKRKRKVFNKYLNEVTEYLVARVENALKWSRDRNAIQTYTKLKK